LTVLGLVGAALLTVKPIPIAGVFTLDIDALLYFAIAAIVGVQITFFGLFAMALARKMKLRVAHGFPEKLLRLASLEGAIVLGICLVGAGLAGALYAIFHWGHTSFGALVPAEIMRITIPSVTTLALGTQIVFGAFLLGFIDIE
jgi:sterol desaturase/sphingolipid hydroxylase (fatty acid hydroxylase superfamily)